MVGPSMERHYSFGIYLGCWEFRYLPEAVKIFKRHSRKALKECNTADCHDEPDDEIQERRGRRRYVS
jgi:hypothetical protein